MQLTALGTGYRTELSAVHNSLAVSNPFDVLKLDDVRLVTGCEIRPVVSTERSIMAAINKFYNRSEEAMSDLIGEISPEIQSERPRRDGR